MMNSHTIMMFKSLLFGLNKKQIKKDIQTIFYRDWF